MAISSCWYSLAVINRDRSGCDLACAARLLQADEATPSPPSILHKRAKDTCSCASNSMGEAVAAWNAVKQLDAPKTYRAWLKARKP
jgi:hypothetical protein